MKCVKSGKIELPRRPIIKGRKLIGKLGKTASHQTARFLTYRALQGHLIETLVVSERDL